MKKTIITISGFALAMALLVGASPADEKKKKATEKGFQILQGFDFRGAGANFRGIGVNSDAGVTGSIVIDEKNFTAQKGAATPLRTEANPAVQNRKVGPPSRDIPVFAHPKTASPPASDQIEIQIGLLLIDRKKFAKRTANLGAMVKADIEHSDPRFPPRIGGVYKTLAPTRIAGKLIETLRIEDGAILMGHPTLTVLNGKEAKFHVGREVVLKHVEEIINGKRNRRVFSRQAGTSIKITPSLIDSESIRLQFRAEHNAPYGTPPEKPKLRSHVLKTVAEVTMEQALLIGEVWPAEGKDDETNGKGILVIATARRLPEKVVGPIGVPLPAAFPAPTVRNAPTVRREPAVTKYRENELLVMPAGSIRVVEFDRAITDVRTYDDETVGFAGQDSDGPEGVDRETKRKLSLRAGNPGRTFLQVIDDQQKGYFIEVLVTGDTREFDQLIRRLYPDAKIEIIELRNSALLRGSVSQPEHQKQIVEIAERFYTNGDVLSQLRVIPMRPATSAQVAPGSGLRVKVPAMGQAPLAFDFAFPVKKPAKPQAAKQSVKKQLRELRGEVRQLRSDVGRLIELLEKQTDRPDKRSGADRTSPRKVDNGFVPVQEEMVTQVYPVADIVVPLPGSHATIGPRGTIKVNEKKTVSENFGSLIEKIKTTIASDSWDRTGGQGSIASHEKNLSLIVKHTPSIQGEIARLLKRLRRLSDAQVSIEMRALTVPDDAFEKLHVPLKIPGDQVILAPEQTARLIQTVQDRVVGTNLRQGPKVTFFNGQIAEVAGLWGDKSNDKLQMHAVLSDDHRSMRFRFAINADSDLEGIRTAKTALLADGHSLLIDVTGQLPPRRTEVEDPILTKLPYVERLFKNTTNRPKGPRRVLMLLTPKIVTVEKEPQKLLPAGTLPGQ